MQEHTETLALIVGAMESSPPTSCLSLPVQLQIALLQDGFYVQYLFESMLYYSTA